MKIKQNKSNWFQWFAVILIISLLYNGLQSIYYNLTLDYCDCNKYGKEAGKYLVLGSDYGSYNGSAIEHCMDEINDLMGWDDDDMSVEYMRGFSYQMCNYGYYETKKGKKIYDN